MTPSIGYSALLLLTVLVTFIPGSIEQNIRGARDGRKKVRRQPPLKSAGAVKDKELMIRALTINYPLSIFETGNTENWRDAAKYSSELVISSQNDKSWKEVSQAQDQEDVWLYENWFYGMEKGVILESGALNGILFSNSFMFEQFANWTAIHVGMSDQRREAHTAYCHADPCISLLTVLLTKFHIYRGRSRKFLESESKSRKVN